MHTGDGGYMDDEGYVFLIDRIKDMIISGGENMYSAEVENALAQHPAVATVAVIGVPDESGASGCTPSSSRRPGARVTLEELRGLCADADRRLQDAAVDGVVDALPRLRRRQGAQARAARVRTGRTRTARVH